MMCNHIQIVTMKVKLFIEQSYIYKNNVPADRADTTTFTGIINCSTLDIKHLLQRESGHGEN